MKTRVNGSGVLAAATVVTGLIAGVYYAFACSVMLGLGASGDRTFIEAMQNINKKIENPVFFLTFFGALILPAWALRTYRQDRTLRLWIAAGLVLYTIGLLTTMAVNIPLNNQLAAAGAPARIADPAAVRARFEDTWNMWNIARALLSTGAAACLARALLLAGWRGETQRAEAEAPTASRMWSAV
ncbi:conserved hypothetical protein [Catenulispora acidiphila DSM 44928]|uniref:DUF1772 domain-containing protein n=1 Tax=Catenulispora acidiphila (strain DSM 44928 / JCM 14897 / NBRC 102108 / NRRL B-24433 / ID139908) TaxID=479433 RepID=C7PWW9_CATAD|nr:anthrone oxygenase family protein [Catenulispora acidiphila]ACU77226.1 conserved hypothetical protein [Catenulispora acidiphila DSM 44928]